MKYDYLIVGAGFSGSVMAERLASVMGKKVLLVEKRNHIGGNAYDEYDEHGILVHRYGPHIFHTNSKKVFDYLSLFTEWIPYEHKVLACHNNEFYPIPINRLTLNKLYKLNLQSEDEVEEFYNKVKIDRIPIRNSEDLILSKIGNELFEIFYKSFTFKQWQKYPKELSPSVCGRIPVRTNDDCRYFTDKYQFMPKYGYTEMFKKMLSHKKIEIVLNQDYKNIMNDVKFDKLVYTGPIDYFFDYVYGKLTYRSIEFSFKNIDKEVVQEVAVINFVDDSRSILRSTEFKHMTAQKSNSTTIGYEIFTDNGYPYYPSITDISKLLYQKYQKKSKKYLNITFCGRLAEYKYINMDSAVRKALSLSKKM